MTTTATNLQCAKILLAIRDEKRRGEAADSLNDLGMMTREVDHPVDVVRVAGEFRPVVLVLDMDIPAGDVLSLVRVLRKNPQTREILILVTCTLAFTRELMKDLFSAGAAGLMLKPLRNETLMEKINGCLTTLADAVAARREEIKWGAQSVPGYAGLLRQELICPFHANGHSFWHYLPRLEKATTETTFFDQPIHNTTAVARAGEACHLPSVAVCPACLFASNDMTYFGKPGTRGHVAMEFNADLVTAVAATSNERRDRIEATSPHFFDHKRTVQDALVIYELGIMNSQLLLGFNPVAFNGETARIGNYHLRMAGLLEKSSASDVVIVRHYQHAAKAMHEAALQLKGPIAIRSAYQLVTILLYLGDDAGAEEQLNQMRKWRGSTELGSEDQSILQRYWDKACRAWEMRFFNRLGTC